MDRSVARQCWRTLEPYHGHVYFAPEAAEEYGALGLPPAAHYFAPRAAPMGAVPAEVVVATFFNFNPSVVRAAIPSAWDVAGPAAVTQARLRVADRAIRRVLGDEVGGPDMARAVELARRAADAACAHPEGRPLFAAHASLPWPTDPHLVLWHAVTLLREFRGDAHVAAMTAEGVTGAQALVLHAATGDIPRAALQTTRGWRDDDWRAAEDVLRSRGWIDGEGALTEAGREHRQRVEDTTDDRALPAWSAIGDDAAAELRRTVRPWSKAISGSGVFGSLRG